jgi:tRNA(adenine34) deaminase
MFDDNYFMNKALQEARIAYDAGEVPVGAVVVMQNKVIGRAHNLTETLKDPTAHAEMMALTAAFSHLGAKYLPDATIYITLEPCHMCAGALYWSKIGRIVYGASDVKNGYRHFLSNGAEDHKVFHPKTEIITGVKAEECAALVTTFFKSRR